MITEINKNVKNAMTGIVEPKAFETEFAELHKRDPQLLLDVDEYVPTLGELFPKNVDDRVVLMVLLLEQNFYSGCFLRLRTAFFADAFSGALFLIWVA